jgi:hypothetical protein
MDNVARRLASFAIFTKTNSSVSEIAIKLAIRGLFFEDGKIQCSWCNYTNSEFSEITVFDHYCPSDTLCRDYNARLATFVNWPCEYFSASEMAKAGLYYTGPEDRVKCPMCKITIHNWAKDDMIESEHFRFSPNCRLSKNLQYNAAPCVPLPIKEEDILCKVCMTEKISVVFLPCGHFCCCKSCASKLGNCPICRVTKTGTIQVFRV